MNEVASVFLKELLSGDKKNLSPGEYKIDEIVKVRLLGTLKKGEDFDAAPTTNIPWLTVFALVLEKSGVTRDSILKIIETSISEALSAGDSLKEKLEERMKDVEKSVERVKGSMKKLPKVKKSGITRVCGSIEVIS